MPISEHEYDDEELDIDYSEIERQCVSLPLAPRPSQPRAGVLLDLASSIPR